MMQILSNDNSMVALTDDLTIRWVKGSHTANVFREREIDVFTFAWDKDKPTQLDFTSALLSYLEHNETH